MKYEINLYIKLLNVCNQQLPVLSHALNLKLDYNISEIALIPSLHHPLPKWVLGYTTNYGQMTGIKINRWNAAICCKIFVQYIHYFCKVHI